MRSFTVSAAVDILDMPLDDRLRGIGQCLPYVLSIHGDGFRIPGRTALLRKGMLNDLPEDLPAAFLVLRRFLPVMRLNLTDLRLWFFSCVCFRLVKKACFDRIRSSHWNCQTACAVPAASAP